MRKQFATQKGYIVYCDDNILRITTPKKFFIKSKIYEIPVKEIKKCDIDDRLNKDPNRKEYLLESATSLLIKLGLWDKTCKGYDGVSSQWSLNSMEGWNKSVNIQNANRLMKENKTVNLFNIRLEIDKAIA